MFSSLYPIICAPMNGVSDVSLAVACAKANIVPSLIWYPFSSKDRFSLAVKQVLTETKDIHVSMSFGDIVINRQMILELGITHIEILEYENSDLTAENKSIINDLRAHGVKIIFKILSLTVIDQFIDIIDAVTVKGSEAAGRSARDVNLADIVAEIKVKYPNLHIIASGGIKNSSDVNRLIAIGACAVSIGTMFAMSKESCIPIEVKNKLLAAEINDISRLKGGARQRAIVFNEQQQDDFNNTSGLYKGLQTGTVGHVFVGNAIGTITEIKSVQEIVDYLTS